DFPFVRRENRDRKSALVLHRARRGGGAGLTRLVERKQHQPDEREPGESAGERFATSVVFVRRATGVREHQHEEERDDDRSGVNDDGGGHQKRGREQEEQSARAENDERERDRPAGGVFLHDENRAENERPGREQPEQHTSDGIGKRI